VSVNYVKLVDVHVWLMDDDSTCA